MASQLSEQRVLRLLVSPREGAAWLDFMSRAFKVLKCCRIRWCLVVVKICLVAVFKEVVPVGI